MQRVGHGYDLKETTAVTYVSLLSNCAGLDVSNDVVYSTRRRKVFRSGFHVFTRRAVRAGEVICNGACYTRSREELHAPTVAVSVKNHNGPRLFAGEILDLRTQL